MKMTIGLIVWAVNSSTADISIEKFVAFKNLNKAVEVLRMKIEDIDPISDRKTSRSCTVVVKFANETAVVIWTGIFRCKHSKTVDHFGMAGNIKIM